MIWKVLRPHYWVLDRKIRTTNRVILIGLIALLPMVGQWCYNNLLRDSIALLGSEQATVTVASFLPLGLFLFLLFAVLGIGDTMYQLYLASDLELLMIAPLPFRTIFLVKLLQCSRATLIPGLIFGAFLTALGMAQGSGPNYFALILLLVLAAMLLATGVVMILVILLARLLPAQKVRSWMPVATILVTMALILGQQPINRWFLMRTDSIAFLTEALLNPRRLALVVSGMGGPALAAVLAGYRLFDSSFHEGWDRFREVPTGKTPSAAVDRGPRGISRLVRLLPTPFRFFLLKEWLELRRNPQGLISLAQPIVLVVAILAPFLSVGAGAETLQPILFWLMMLYLTVFLSTLPLNTSLTAITQEGRRIALLRSAPISMAQVLKGKFWAIWAPVTLSWVVVLVITGMLLRFPLWQTSALLGVTVWGVSGSLLVTAAIGGLKADFSAKELRQRISALTSSAIMGLNLLFVLLSSAVSAWLILLLVPESPVALVIQSLVNYGAMRWFTASNPWIPLYLAGGQVAFWIGARVLWSAAVRRLEKWEES